MNDAKSKYLDIYFEELVELFDGLDHRLDVFGAGRAGRAELDALRRIAHTVKSSAALMGFGATRDLALALEEAYRAFEAGGAPDAAVREEVCLAFRFLRDANAALGSSGIEDVEGLSARALAVRGLVAAP